MQFASVSYYLICCGTQRQETIWIASKRTKSDLPTGNHVHHFDRDGPDVGTTLLLLLSLIAYRLNS